MDNAVWLGMFFALALAGCGTQHTAIPLSQADRALTALGPVTEAMRLGAGDGTDGDMVDVVWGRKTGAKCVRWDIQFGLDNSTKLLKLIKALKLESSLTDYVLQGSTESGNDINAQTITYGAFDGARVYVPKGSKLVVRRLHAFNCTNQNYNKEISPLTTPAAYDPNSNVSQPNVSTVDGYELMMKFKTK